MHGDVLRGVIFDLDGVLVATDGFHYQAWKALADELKLAFDERINRQLRGVSRQQSLRNIYKANRKPWPEDGVFRAQCDQKNRRYVELVNGMTAEDVLPGVVDLLDALRKAGIRTAIASASRNAALVLERTDLRGRLDAVADGNDTARAKPDPDVFLVALKKLALDPADCLGVEDATAGVEAIHAAGMIAIGIGGHATGADGTFPSLARVTAADLFQVFA